MPFYVYGKNALTGEVAKRQYSEATTREEARQQAESQGLEVTEIVACNPQGAAPLPLVTARRAAPSTAPLPSIAARKTPATTPPAANVAASARTISAGPISPGAPSSGAISAGAISRSRLASGPTSPSGAIGQFRQELDYATSNTYVTYALIAANVLVFGMMCLSGVSPKDPTINGLLAWGADFGPKSLGGQWWRLLTSTFVHIGFLHLLYNMLALVPAGRSLERLVGNMNFLLVYIVAGLGGSLWALYWTPMIISAGASGAVFGVYGALGAVVFLRGRMLPPDLVASLKKSVYTFVIYNAVYSFRPGVSLSAHVGGLVIGFVCGMLVANADPSQEAETILDRPKPLLAFGAALVIAGLFALQLRYPELSRLQEQFARFDALDMKNSVIVSDAANKFDKKDLSGAEFAQIMNRDVLPDWDAVRDQLAAYQPVPRGMQEHISAITDYMKLREEGWKLLSDALLAGSKDKLDVAGKKMREGNYAERDLFHAARTRIFPEGGSKS